MFGSPPRTTPMPPPSPPRTESPFASSVRWPAASPRRSRSTSMTLSASIPPSLRSSHPFLLGHRRRHSDAPEIAQVTRFEAGKTTLPRETERRRGRVRAAGWTAGGGNVGRSPEVPCRSRTRWRAIESVGTGDENGRSGRQRRPIIRHLPDNQSCTLTRPPASRKKEGPGFM